MHEKSAETLPFNPGNERIKERYREKLRGPDQLSEGTVRTISNSIRSFEEYTRYRDFKTFNRQDAIGFREYLEQAPGRHGKPATVGTRVGRLIHLKRFFSWLAFQPGFKRHVSLDDAAYFNPPQRDVRAARAGAVKVYPKLDDILRAVRAMPTRNEVELRNQAMLAFMALTGVRDAALVSLKLKHVFLEENLVIQAAPEVHTKNGKTIYTYFFPVDNEFKRIACDWVNYLRDKKRFSRNDPLFPVTGMRNSPSTSYVVQGLLKRHYTNTGIVRKVFKAAFESVGLPYYHPHSFRHTLVHLGMELCRDNWHQAKAWSQNFGHETTATTETFYGKLPHLEQGKVIKTLGQKRRGAGDLMGLSPTTTVAELLRHFGPILEEK